MSDIRLFRLVDSKAAELQGEASDLEKVLQTLIEKNLDALLGIRFLATEYSTGKTHAGRIDSLGLDENNCPVILEYKRSTGENVINQGLFYLDWLMDHKAEFHLLVMEKYGKSAADQIDWAVPRLVCVAADFTKYDGHAVQQMNRNIDLIRYRRFGQDLLLLEQVNSVSAPNKSSKPAKSLSAEKQATPSPKSLSADKPFSEWLTTLTPEVREVLDSLDDYVGSLGDDIQVKDLKLYRAYKRIKNFATVVLQKKNLLLFLHLDPDKLPFLPTFARDARKFGHWGTGDLELAIASSSDLEAVKPLVLMAYEGRTHAASAKG